MKKRLIRPDAYSLYKAIADFGITYSGVFRRKAVLITKAINDMRYKK